MKKTRKKKLTFFRMLPKLFPLVIGASPGGFTILSVLSVLHEEGTHDELMARGGIYAAMFESQAKWYTREETPVQTKCI